MNANRAQVFHALGKELNYIFNPISNIFLWYTNLLVVFPGFIFRAHYLDALEKFKGFKLPFIFALLRKGGSDDMNNWRKKTQKVSKLILTSGPRALTPKNLYNFFNN